MLRPRRSPAPLAILLAAGLLAPACTTTETGSLQEGFNKYTAQQFEQSELIADTYIRANPNAADLDQAYYLRGISRMTRGNRVTAAADLHTAITKTTRADLRSKAYRALGDMAFDQLQWPDAIANYQLALDNLTLAPAAVTYLNYRIGATLQNQGEWLRSEAWFSKVIAANNDPALADRALRRLHLTGFALQFGAFQDAAGAQALVARLQAAGISATTSRDVREGNKIWYLVQSGSYPVWAEAAAARDRVPRAFTVTIVP